MKQLLVIWVFIHSAIPPVYAQEIPVNTEQQLENLTDADQAETEDDSYLQQLEYFRKNPVDLNTADVNELKELRILTDLQIESLVSYRRLLGKLISIYELQAVPAWDIITIKKLLPFITVTTNVTLTEQLSSRFKDGEHSLLFRLSQVLEKAKGFNNASIGTRYLGSPQRLFFRYRYSYKNLLQYGVVADKDAGEQFFKGAQRKGFDFYSFHLFARKMGLIQSLAIGDFTVNMGQGLIQWQSLAFKKSADVLGVKRQSPVLRPYNSAGEFYFHRGAGITIKKGRVEATAFASIRKISANFAADTVNNEDFVSSLLNSGYHRTAGENDDRNKLTQTSFGGNALYRGNRWYIGLNTVYYQFSRPLQKRDEPYNLYAVNGKSWYNFSVDYSYTYKNLHFFGEAAVAKNSGKAFVNGLLVSVDPRVDISFVQRTIAAPFQAVYGNAFTENAYPTNETGFFSGISIRPANGWKLDAYADIFKFPWLKYLVDAPSRGTDFLAQLSYTPNRYFEIYTRFRNESKQTNQTGNISTTNFLVNLPRQSWRTQFSYKLNNMLSLRNRVEALWYDKRGNNRETGFIIYSDIIYRPILRPFSGILRLQYFETDDYNSRIYAYENDLLYSFSIPAFFDKGYRYYLLINYELGKKLSFWLRFAQTIYPGKQSVGSGLDEINGDRKTELKAQIRWIL